MPLGRLALSVLVVFAAACATTPRGPSEAARQALAPTGKLRVGLISVPVHAIRDPYSGELRGVSHDLGRELAARLGVPFEPIMHPNPAAYLAAAQAGRWDVGSVGMSPEREPLFDFASPHLEVEFGYLVPAGSRITTVEEADRPGVRVAMVAHSNSDEILTKSLKRASIVRGASMTALRDLLEVDGADVIAAQKANLVNLSVRIPGSRVLEGSPGSERMALAMPTRRDPAGLAYLRAFAEDVKRSGLVMQAIDRAGLGGVAIPR